jgi:hypothetical protein
MIRQPKKVLIVDEPNFVRVCSAILQNQGLVTDSLVSSSFDHALLSGYELIVVAYPYAANFLEDVEHVTVPVLFLADLVDDGLLAQLQKFMRSFCITKPLDFRLFSNLVKNIIKKKGFSYAKCSAI